MAVVTAKNYFNTAENVSTHKQNEFLHELPYK